MKRISETSSPDGTVLDFCRPNFITVGIEEKVGAAIAQVRQSAQPGHIFYLYVVNPTQELCGIVSIRNLLLADDETLVSQVYSPLVVTLDRTSQLARAYHVFAKSRFLSLPVVDEKQRIIGVVHAHEIASGFKPAAAESLFEDRTRRELFELLGIQAEDARRNPAQIAVGRLPWLLLNVTGGVLCAVLIHALGNRLDNALEFLAFIPVLLVVSESLGMQTASLAIADLHGSARRSSTRRILREFFIAGLLGLICALFLGTTLFLWKHSVHLATTVASTILIGCLVVSLVGNLVPYLFHRWKIDPRIAAGPVVLSLADFSTLLVYLLVARALSGF